MAEELDRLQEALGHRFSRPALLEQALTHPSWLAEHPGSTDDNQRLEFLGDAVLQLVVTAVLFEGLPGQGEGVLTRLRSALTREKALADYALSLGLDEALRLGKGERRYGGARRPSNLADAFEALLGALYLDGGLPAAEALIRRLLEPALRDVESLLAVENPKGALQEYTQERFHALPQYQTVHVEGPDHEPRFEVAVLFQGRELARAVAGSRRAAECQAADAALRRLRESGHGL